MRGANRFNVHTRTVAAPMMAAAAQQSHYDHRSNQLAPQQAVHSSPHQAPHSPWRSPVPYLFGGLAAMLGLIAFALLILACSYWKLSGYLEGGEGGARDGDVEGGEQQGGEKGASSEKVAAQVYEQKIVVIMAGDEKPTYLATPMASRNNSFGEEGKSSKRSEEEEEGVVVGGGASASERKVEDGGETSGRIASPVVVAAAASKDGENSHMTTHRDEQATSREDERMPQ